MAESTLSITYNTIAREVGHFLGWGRDRTTWDSVQVEDFSDVLARGYRMFLFPPLGSDQPYYEWSFLRKTGSITLATGDADYDMGDDFGGVILDRSINYAAASNKRMLLKIPESEIRGMQAMDPATGVPRYCAVRNKAHNEITGQRWEMLVYPTPTAAENALVITFRYVYVPDLITTTNIYPVGGAQYSEVVLAAMLAAAEYKVDDEPEGMYYKKFIDMLNVAIRNDQEQKINDRGGDV